MKKFIYGVLLSFALLLGMMSCSDNSNTLSPVEELKNNIISGSWYISYYWDDKAEETGDFNAFTFTFESDGRLIAKSDSTTITGTWTSYNDDGKLKLNIKFFSSQLFEDISDDWNVAEQTEIKIRLEDVSGGDGATDYLTFEKKQ